MDSVNDYKLAFIIGHKYFEGYPSYLQYYIDNINKIYPNSLIIVVDNNSTNPDKVSENLAGQNVTLLRNNIECKFELGAYKVGMEFIIAQNLLHQYDYFIFTQDTYVLKNKYDFNILKQNAVEACSLIGWRNDWEIFEICAPVLRSIGLVNKLDEANLCWCNSFIVSNKKLVTLYDLTKDIIITNRRESMASERYLGLILFELNNQKNFAIDGPDNNYLINGKSFNCLEVDMYSDVNKYFCKVCQQKNETTRDK